MFVTERQARIAFANQVAKRPNIGRKIGDHLAELALTPAHGVQTVPTNNGHFDLHEYEAVDLVTVATLRGPL